MGYDWSDIAQIAAMQHGKVHVRQLLSIGMTRCDVHGRTKVGALIRDRRGVYAVGHVPDTPESRWSGAVLAAGDGAVLSHLAAARLWRLLPWEPDRIDVSRPRQRRQREGMVCHTTPLDDDERSVHRGIAVTSVSRTIADCAQLLDEDVLVRLLREARHLGMLDLEQLGEYCAPGSGRTGSPRLRRALAKFSGRGAGYRSKLEREVRDVLVARGAPEPCINVTYATDIGPIEVDQSWPRHNVCLEVDGPTHLDAEQRLIDERNRGALRRAGWDVHVVDYIALRTDVRRATDEVIAALARHATTFSVAAAQ